jgi:nuclear pore complex protein Nup50
MVSKWTAKIQCAMESRAGTLLRLWKNIEFCSIGGIGSLKSTISSSPFSFLANVTSTPTATSISSANGSAADKTDSSKMNDTKTDDKQDETDQATLDYYAKIKRFNESVSKWIKAHVEADPVCDLTPVFKEY